MTGVSHDCTPQKEPGSNLPRTESGRHGRLLFGLWLCFLAVGCVLWKASKDDLAYRNISMSLYEFISYRFNTWSSRWFVEGALFFFCREALFWFKAVNTLLLFFLPFVLSRITAGRAAPGVLFAALCLLFMYPFADMETAGLQATTVNYFWPLFAALVAVLIMREQLSTGQSSYARTGCALFCLVFACNNEQLCAVLLLLVPVLFVCLKGKWPPLFYGYAILVGCSALVIILCPGNMERYVREIHNWNPDFVHLSQAGKIVGGYTSTTLWMMATSYIYYVFVAMSSLLVFLGYKQKIYRMISLVPLSGLSFLWIVHGPYDQLADISYVLRCATLPVSIPCLVSVVLSMVLTARSGYEAIMLPALLAAGLGSRVLLGFSPTLYVSSTRTFLFLDAVLICLALFIYGRLSEELSRAGRLRLDIFLGVTAAVAFLSHVR